MRDLMIRDDDINAYSDLDTIRDVYTIIRKRFSKVRIISCVSLLAKTNGSGNVYPFSPVRGRPTKDLYGVDSVLNKTLTGLGEIASHGLLHIDHSKVSKDAQEMSILTSCNILNTKLFCAPFNGYNSDTLAICKENGIELITNKYKWLSLEFNKFNHNHRAWYFHSWRYDVPRIKKELG